jgi:hypothetical protein
MVCGFCPDCWSAYSFFFVVWKLFMSSIVVFFGGMILFLSGAAFATIVTGCSR